MLTRIFFICRGPKLVELQVVKLWNEHPSAVRPADGHRKWVVEERRPAVVEHRNAGTKTGHEQSAADVVKQLERRQSAEFQQPDEFQQSTKWPNELEQPD